jgi:hypothetical protein
MSFPLAIAILALFQCSKDIEPTREHKPTKVKATKYTQQEPMYVIKESYNKTRKFYGKEIYYCIKNMKGEYNRGLDVVRSLPTVPCFPHTFDPRIL